MSGIIVVRVVGGLAIVAVAVLGGRAASLPATTGVAVGAAVVALALGAERLVGVARIDRLMWGALGGIVGVLGGTIVGHAIRDVAPSIGPLLLALSSISGLYLGALVGLRRGSDVGTLGIRPPSEGHVQREMKLLDTSAIIDGRIADLAATGFIDGPLVVPQFVLRELQQIADSSDPRRRARGKRGFDVVQRLQRLPGPLLEIGEMDAPGTAVDDKLLALAKARGAKVLTTDYNLNKLAEVNGVIVLNVNELANALKSALVAGEELRVHVVREGKEAGQGIGYLDDGTMVVVDQGKRWLGQNVDAVVTSVLQTPAGRIIFTRLRDEEPARA